MDQSMKFTGARPLARHCSELLAHRMRPADRSDDYRRLNRRLSAMLPAVFSAFYGEADLSVRTKEMNGGSPDDMLLVGDQQRMHFLLKTTATGAEIVVSIDQVAIFEMVDRAFGGDGKAPALLPEKLPRSAHSILERLERNIADLLRRIAPGNVLAGLVPMKRETDITMLRSFVEADEVRTINFTGATFGGQPWSLEFMMEPETLDSLCEDEASIRPKSKREGPAGAHEKPFCDVPLELTATLIDMMIPLSRLSGLKPGDVIPVAVARNVPLSVGGKIVARGSVGEVDDCVALQITSAF